MMYICCLLLSLCTIICQALKTVVVSEFSTLKADEVTGFIHLSHAMQLVMNSSVFSPIVGCYSDGSLPGVLDKLHGVELVQSMSFGDKNDKDWKMLLCGLRVADVLFSRGYYDTEVVFVGSQLVPNIDVVTEELIDYCLEGQFYCYPRNFAAASVRGACELDYYRLKVSTGSSLFNVIRSMKHIQLSANDALQLGLSQLEFSLSFFPVDSVLRVFSYVNGPRSSDLSSYKWLEIDGANHKIITDKASCTMKLHVEWPEFGAVPVLVNALAPIIESDEWRHQFVGCAPFRSDPDTSLVKLHDLPLQHQSTVKPHRVFDCILFFDEISLLLLRLELLKDVVDLHILVEAPKTFTGKPKPLYFQENEELFAAYRHKILVVSLQDLPTPRAVGDVWMNEYESRNALVEGLLAVEATDDDVILVADTDELIDPEAIRSMLSVLRYNDYVRSLGHSPDGAEGVNGMSNGGSKRLLPEYFKLFQHQYLYNFNCSLDDVIAKESRSSIATVRECKRISHHRSAARASAFVAANGRKEYPYYLIDARNHMSNAPVFPLSQLLSPGGVHLSFFESLERIKRKLESYSHQNFASQFHATSNGSDEGSKVGYDLKNQDSLPVGEVSVDSLMSRIQQGEVINFKNRKQNMRCIERPVPDAFVQQVKDMWDAMAKEEDIVYSV